ncbi:MAG: VWA domain-containing protein [Halanaerobiaceae bacterium]
MILSFAHPVFFALFLLLPLLYYYYRKNYLLEYRYLVVRIVLFSLLILALTGPRVDLPVTNQNIMFVADSSQSISRDQKEVSRNFISEALNHKQEVDRAGIINFGTESLVEQMPRQDMTFEQFSTEPESDYTNLEKALDLGNDLLSGLENRRLILLSDGQENYGQTLRAVQKMDQDQITVDVVPLEEESQPEVLLTDMTAPRTVEKNVPFNIKVNITSGEPVSGNLLLEGEEDVIASRSVELKEGQNVFTFSTQLEETGNFHFRARIEPERDTKTENNRGDVLVQVQGPQKLLFAGERNSGLNQLAEIMADNNYDSDFTDPEDLPQDLAGFEQYSAVILNDVSADMFSGSQLEALQRYVYERGGGLLVSGGENSFGPGNYDGTVLEEMLPVESGLKQEVMFPTLSLLLIIDKSGSMDEQQPEAHNLTKLDLAQQAAAAALDTLQDREKIGVIAFDIDYEEIVTLQKAENRSQIKEQIREISIGGGTDIYPALEYGKEILQEDDSEIKHIILLSDGISDPGDFEELTSELRQNDISLTTIAVGEDVDRELMRNLARWGEGEEYYTTDLEEIPQIYISEVRRIPRRAVQQGTIQPRAPGNSFLLEGISEDNIPQIEGYIATTPRSRADNHLITTEHYPLLSTWRYGLGNSAVFTSDLATGWTANWQNWQDFARLGTNLVSWISRDFSSEFLTPKINIQGREGEITVSARDIEGNYLNFLDLQASLNSPGQEVKELDLQQVGPGSYQASFTAQGPGIYTAKISSQEQLQGQEAFASTTVPYSPEYRTQGARRELLEEIADQTGGRVLSSPGEVFNNRELSFSQTQELWYILLILALVIYIIDIGLRTVNINSLKQLFSFRKFQ